MKLKLQKGQCENCGFKGLLRRVSFVPKSELDVLTAGEPIYSREADICIECAETPTGCVSENSSHKRLPDAEYVVK